MTKLTTLSVLALPIIIMACTTGTKTVATSEPKTEKSTFYPSWYIADTFEADSVYFEASALASHADSTTAVQNAERQARAELESYLAIEIEKARLDLEESYASSKSSAFIMMLRNSHAQIETEASISTKEAKRTESGFVGFANARIEKSKAKSVIQRGFSSNVDYFRNLSSNPVFMSLFN